MVEVIRKGGVNVGHRDSREHGDDLARRTAPALMPRNNIRDANPMPGDSCPPAADARRFRDVLNARCGHRRPFSTLRFYDSDPRHVGADGFVANTVLCWSTTWRSLNSET